MRKGEDFGSKNVRAHKNPLINFDANALTEIISWKETECYEPIFTCDISTADLERIRSEPFKVPKFPIHSQSTERAVQQVSQAAMAVFGEEKRENYVKARIAHRELLPVFSSKKDIRKLF